MADSDEIFLAAELGEVVRRVERALGLQDGQELDGGDGELGYVGSCGWSDFGRVVRGRDSGSG